MGIRVELHKNEDTGTEWIRVAAGTNLTNVYFLDVPHAEFKAACCRDLGLVDPLDYGNYTTEDPFFEKRYIEAQAQRAADITMDKAATVLAAASRRLA